MTTTARLSKGGSARTATQTLTITVLCGGPSREREVSLESGQATAAALKRLGHDVRVSDIGPDRLLALEEPADLVFIALHGTFGEDGQLQAILESRGLPYVGSDSASSALAMDKIAAKKRFRQAGLPTPDFAAITSANLEEYARSWPLPAVVKPADQGSSVDTFIVRTRQELPGILHRLVGSYGRCLLESYVHGKELTVGILGDQPLPVCEICTLREFYDYQAKYHDDATQYRFDPGLPGELLDRVATISLQAHHALGCRDFSRVDVMVDESTRQPYLLEVNTIPGFTSHSLLPKAARRVDIDFDGLCQRIVDLAMRRAR